MKNSKREMPSSFGQKLKFYRTEKKLSLHDVFLLTGISESYINRMERGERKAPSFPIIERLAKALMVNVSDLIDVTIPEMEPVRDVLELLLYHEFTIRDKKANRYTKESLIETLKVILQSEWDERSKYKESIQIMEKIDNFLKTLN